MPMCGFCLSKLLSEVMYPENIEVPYIGRLGVLKTMFRRCFKIIGEIKPQKS